MGKVNKLLPEGMAEINYNGQKTIAKLEAPLAAGNQYLFQTDFEEGILKLRVISEFPSEAKISNTALAEKLLSDLQLPKGGSVKELVSILVKNSIPFSKAELALMGELLAGTTEKQSGIEAIVKLKGDQLPVSKPLYQSYLQGKSMEPVSAMLEGLETSFNKTDNKSIEMRNVLRILNSIKEVESTSLFQKVSARISDMLLNPKVSDSQRAAALNLLQLTGLLPEESTLESVKTLPVKEGMPNQPTGPFLNSSPSHSQVRDKLTTMQELMAVIKAPDTKIQGLVTDIQTILKGLESEKVAYKELLTRAISLIKEGEGLLTQKGMLPLLSEGDRFNLLFGLHSEKEKQVVSHFSQMIKQLPENGEPQQPALKLLQQLLFTDEGNGAGLHKENLPDIIKDLIARLGTNHEAKLAAGIPAEKSHNETLKPALIALLQDLPQGEAREIAEKLLYRLNGHSLLSGENGPLQQIVYQVPLTWMNQKTDVTFQWSGRKTAKGQIDPEFCRVLFYLELEAISEVIVDMGVQNKVISLNIYNDNPLLKELSAPFSPVMKEGLEKLGYKVSVINFKVPDDSVSTKSVYQEMAGDISYSGVDLKI
ncbi:hypothetical protein BSG1_20185 [Bacillus sp. SG-1]|nr:hypothetical protein BSG1_20185 [Bacillus sp. SG-1]